MKKMNFKLIAIIAAVVLIAILTVLALVLGGGMVEVPTDDVYSYINPDESKAQTDQGITIDGVLDEEVYQNNNWLYLHNDDGGNNVDIAMTSYYGEKGMYFVYDVTESVPIYVNLNRNSYMNSCIEMYFAPSTVTSLKENSYFEVDMLPTGDMVFKKSNGKGGYVNAATTGDIMAHLGATTKGGEVNTESCYGYCLELFIPWEYMDHLGLDTKAMKDSFVYVDPAHITSHNHDGTDTSVDRYWYFYAQQQGAGFSDIYQYFRFNGSGVLGTSPIILTQGEGYTLSADPNVIPGMQTEITVTPESGKALTSILVNGQEQIQNVAFDQNGAVVLKIRGQKEGLTVSAATEAVAAGKKTLSGTVRLNKVGGASLDGVRIKYAGPTGEKPITLDSKGNFQLTELEQGYYTLTVEKEGFTALARGIYLNRDVDTQLTLEYDTFYAELGTSWVLDRQNEGVLSKFGGRGYLLTTESYSKFTYKANFFYNEALTQEADTDFFQQQRSGMRILFSNGKYWHIDLLKENGKYIVQYAKHSGDNSVFGWKGLCQMDASQIAQYTDEKGIELSVVRDGQYAAVFLAGKLLTIEKLDDSYANCTAKLGLEYWVANRDILQIPYSISGHTAVNVKNAVFNTAKEWDLSGMFDGVLKIPGSDGDSGWLDSSDDQYKEVDLKLILRDQRTDDDNFRAAAALSFGNGLNAIYTITNDNSNDDDPNVYVLQTMASSFSKWGVGYTLTAQQVAKLQSEDGLEFRLVRIGDTVDIYLDGEHIKEYDLTNTLEGQPSQVADQTAKVQLRMYGNQGKTVSIPFTLAGKVENQVKLDIKSSQQGTVKADQKTYLMGDTVTLSDGGAAGYYCSSMLLDGKAAELDELGRCSFTAEKNSYTVEGVFAERIWNSSKEWNVAEQNQGMLSVPGSDGDSGWIESYSHAYKDLDLRLTLHDGSNGDGNYRAAVALRFGNDMDAVYTVTNAASAEDATTVYQLQTMPSSFHKWGTYYTLTQQQAEKLQSQGGLEFRLIRIGDTVDIYLGGEHVKEFDLTNTLEGQPSQIADQAAKVELRMYGNQGKTVRIPFVLDSQVENQVKLDIKSSQQGTLKPDQKTYLMGDRVTLSDGGAAGYYCKGVLLNGKMTELNALGQCSFTAEKNSYTAEGVFTERVWSNSQEWNVAEQHQGVLSIPGSDGDSGWVETYSDACKDLDLRLTLRDGCNGDGNYRAAVALRFTNGIDAVFTVTNAASGDDATTVYGLQTMPSSFHKWGTYYTLSQQQSEKLQSQDGLELQIVRVGTQVAVYMDGTYAISFDLTDTREGQPSQIEDLGMKVQLRFYGNKGQDVLVPYEMYNQVKLVDVTVADCAHGTVTTDRNLYLVGDQVTLTVQGDSDYDFSSLQVNGKTVSVNADGTYHFAAQKDSYQVSATFEKGAFIADKDRTWNLIHQNQGILRVSRERNGAAWIQTRDNYNEMTLTVKDFAGGNVHEYAVVGQLYFENGKYISIRLIYDKNNDKYTLQSMGDSVANWATHHTLTAEQYAKVRGDGIRFTMRRIGTNCMLYLDDALVKTVDLTGRNSGITPEMTCVAKVRYYNNGGYDVAMPYVLGNPNQTGTVTVAACANGKIVADKTSYTIGETVTLTVVGDTDYYHNGLNINGETVMPAADGSYRFVTSEASYTVSTEFTQGVFKNFANNPWILTNQNMGILHISKDQNGAGWMEAKGNCNELTLTVKDFAGGNTHEYAVVGQLYFANQKYISIRLIYDKNNDKYTLQSMGDSVANWATHHTLTAEQYAKVRGEGIRFTMRRIGTNCMLYLDDVLVKTVDLTGRNSGITPGMTCVAKVRFYNNGGYDVTLPYVLGDPKQTGTVTVADCANGKIVADKTSYTIGETVMLTVVGDSGYYHNGLNINGETVLPNADGTYSLVTSEGSYHVSTEFTQGVFKDFTNNPWILTNQNAGALHISKDQNGAGWMEAKGVRNELTLTVKDYAGGNNHEYAVVGQLYFANQKYISIRLIYDKNNDKYTLQSMGDSVANWATHHTLTAEQYAKVRGDGIQFKMVREGTNCHLYLDEVLVKTVDLTGRGSGITADMTCVAKVRYYNNKGYDVTLPFVLGEEET